MIVITDQSGTKHKLPLPCEYSADLTDIDLQAERAGGYLIRNSRVRERVWKINIGWNGLSPQQVMAIMEATKDTEFTALFDAPTPTFCATAKMYCGPVHMEVEIFRDESKPAEKTYILSLSLVEY